MKNSFSRLVTDPVVFCLACAFMAVFAPFAQAVQVTPDLHVSKNRGSGFKGADVYNATGADQSVNRKTKGKSVKSFVKVENDGPDDNIMITGSRETRKFQIRYFVDGANRTAAIIKGTFSPRIKGNLFGGSAGSEVNLVQKTRPTGKLRGKRGRKMCQVTGRGSSGLLDRVRITVRKTR